MQYEYINDLDMMSKEELEDILKHKKSVLSNDTIDYIKALILDIKYELGETYDYK